MIYYLNQVNPHVRIQRGGGGGRGSRYPLNNHKNIGFLILDPLKNHKTTKATFHAGRAIIGMPAKHHLNGVLLAG